MGNAFSVETLLQGVIIGIPYGLLSVGLVLIYKVSRFINFAQSAMGAFGGALVGTLVVTYGVPYWAAFVIGILFAAGVGAASEAAIVRRLVGQPRLMGVVVTLLLAQFLLVLSFAINTDAQIGNLYPSPPGFPDFEVGNLVVVPSYTALLVLSPLVVIAVLVLLKFTRFGAAIRATSANPDAAWTAGISPKKISSRTWALAGAIAAFSAILLWPTSGVTALAALGPGLMLRGLIGASIARFERIGVAFVAGVGVGLLDTIARASDAKSGVVDMLLTGIALVVLLVRPPKVGRQTESDGDWTKLSLRPLHEAYRSLWIGRHFALAMTAFVFASVAIAGGIWFSNSGAAAMNTAIAFAIVSLSVYLLTGKAGQLSLGQFAIAAVASVASVKAVSATQVFWLGPIAAMAVGALVSVVLGLPALRARGLVLPITTLAFALATYSWILPQEWMLGGGGLTVDQLVLGPIAFDEPKTYYFYALAVLALATAWVAWFTRSRIGRDLVALRDNEGAARALGVSVAIRRLQAFVVAGALAGLGGSVLAHAAGTLTSTEKLFEATGSIDVVVSAVVGGLGAVGGPLLGALITVGVPLLAGLDIVAQAGLQALFLVLVLFRPGGLLSIMLPIRDWIVEEIARVRGLDPREIAARPVKTLGTPFHGSLAAAPHPRTGAPAEIALEARGLAKHYGGIKAVKDVSLSVRDGEAVAIIGPNGAGKTTLFEMVAGFVRPNAGEVHFQGRAVTRWSAQARARAGLVRSFQNALLFPTMSVREAVQVARARGLEGSVDVDQHLAALGLGDYADQAVGTLSTGVRRMVELAADLAMAPRVLLLDEPSAGIAHAEIPALASLLRSVHAAGVTLVVIDHDMNLLRAVCDRFVALNLGEVLAEGTADEVQSSPAVVEAFLGTEAAAIERTSRLAAPTS